MNLCNCNTCPNCKAYKNSAHLHKLAVSLSTQKNKAKEYSILTLIIARIKKAKEDIRNYEVVISQLQHEDYNEIRLTYEDKVKYLTRECEGIDINKLQTEVRNILPLNYFEN